MRQSCMNEFLALTRLRKACLNIDKANCSSVLWVFEHTLNEAEETDEWNSKVAWSAPPTLTR